MLNHAVSPTRSLRPQARPLLGLMQNEQLRCIFPSRAHKGLARALKAARDPHGCYSLSCRAGVHGPVHLVSVCFEFPFLSLAGFVFSFSPLVL